MGAPITGCHLRFNPVLRCMIPSGSDLHSREVGSAAGSHRYGSCAEGTIHISPEQGRSPTLGDCGSFEYDVC